VYHRSALNRNTTNYRDNHKYRDAMEIILHFINVKYLNVLTNRNENKPARAMVALTLRRDVAATCL